MGALLSVEDQSIHDAEQGHERESGGSAEQPAPASWLRSDCHEPE